MAKCPNRTRKTVGAGGGEAGCRGEVEIIVSIPVTMPVKRIPKVTDGFGELVKSNIRKHGVRVTN